MEYSHYCPNCNKWYPCSHSDPELYQAIGACGHILILKNKDLETNKKELALFKSEISNDTTVTYR